MKTSNYIIIAFFTFLFGGVFVLFLAAKFHQDEIMKSVNKTLDPFSVVIAESGVDFILRPGDPNIMSLTSLDTCYLPKFELRNDTLIIYSYLDERNKQNVNVYCRNIHEIQGKENSKITVQGNLNSKLLIKLNNSNLFYYQEQEDKKVSSIKLVSNESYVDLGTVKIEKLDILLNSSKLVGWNNSIDSLSGTLKNKSEIYVKVLNNINIEADSTSSYNIHK